MKINRKKVVEVEAKVIKIHAKPCDSGNYTLMDQNGEQIHDHDGYVPGFFPGGGGDYLELDVDIETGKILNWKPPTKKQIEEFIAGSEDA